MNMYKIIALTNSLLFIYYSSLALCLQSFRYTNIYT